MKTILEIAKKILDLNQTASLTGSLMLKLRGIDLGREPHDIDILICDYATNIILPDGFEVEEISSASGGFGVKFRHGDIFIDVLSDGGEPENHNGWRLDTVENLMKWKYKILKDGGDNAIKHRNDLDKMIKMGFEFPESQFIDLKSLGL